MTLFHRAKINDFLFPQHISKKICSLGGGLFIQCLELSMMVCWGSKLSLCNTGRASHSSYQCSLISFTDIKLQ